LIENKLTNEQIKESVEKSFFCFRSGFFEIFELLEKEKVPTLIFSAGLADVIRDMLLKEYTKKNIKKIPSNVHVISNLMHFNEKGEIKQFDGKMIHGLNKNASVLLDTCFWSQCQMEKRHNILLLGDSIGDANMANGLDYQEDEIIKIGFLNTKINERIEEYLDTFDIVLIGDASLSPVELLLHQIK
jgi:5'-nucleotidase